MILHTTNYDLQTPFHPPYEAQSNTIKQVSLFGPLYLALVLALYNTSKFLTDILTPIQNLNGYSVSNSMDFTKQVANQEIADDEVMVSFDVVSLFTAIPVDKACDYIRKKLDEDTTLHLRTKLNTDEIISLLEFTLSNNYCLQTDTWMCNGEPS